MPKKKKISKSDQDILKHYEAYENLPHITDSDLLKQRHLKKVSDKVKESNPEFIKANIAVDRLMSKRKNAVIKNPSPEKKPED